MMEPRVIEIIRNYEIGNLQKVYEYLTQSDMIIDEKSWANQIKTMIENKQFETAKQTIELVGYKFINIKKNDKSQKHRNS